jgi:tRNA (uracil-5-)-methyltransferase TRM9
MTNTMSELKIVYNEIAPDFERTRVSVWPCVYNFLDMFKCDDYLLDIGCGNGKNMLYRDDLRFKGIDLSDELVKICQSKKLDVIEASMTRLPFKDNTFDGSIAVASYHHLDNDIDRKQTLDEIYRTLKPKAKCLIVVWAMEQPIDSKFHFTKSDELVRWQYNKKQDKKLLDTLFTKIYYRYYHIYSKHDLVNEITRLKPEFLIEKEGWEKGNWYVVISK